MSALMRLRPRSATADPINIQFHERHHGLPQGARDADAPQHPQQWLFHWRNAAALTPEDRLCIPVPLYHCFGMVLGNLACFTHGSTIVHPNDGF